MKTTLIAVPLLLLLGVAGAGCAGDAAPPGDATSGTTSSGASGPAAGAPAVGGELPAGRTFVSTAVTAAGKNKPLVTGTTIRLQILEPNRIMVQAGCNSAQGAARLSGDKLVVEDLSTTGVGCEQALHQQDEWITGFFRAGPTWRLSGNDLVLTGTDIEVKMVDNTVAQPAKALYGTKWTVETLVSGDVASSVPADTTAFMTFSADGKVAGSTGCNSFGGLAKVEGDKITFGDLVMTKKACDGGAGALEASVLQVLEQPVTYRIDGSKLILSAPDGSGLHLVS
jgi:heat shock protein HslJ